ncbi:MAG: DNA-binding protein [Methylobacillus sp.]|nr:DNA-binding protein [Methylobacillus sp.]
MNEKLLTIDVSSREEIRARMKSAFGGKADKSHRYTFLTHEDLLRTLTPSRWRLIEALTGAGPLGVRELARRVERDVKTVHTDAQSLVLIGLLDKTDDGKISFPYEAVDVHFSAKGMRKAA